MIPPLPPAMPPWPGGKTPWEHAREAQEKQEAERQEAERQKAEAERAQAEQQKAAQQAAQQQAQYQQYLASLRPRIMHGLVPPQMLGPTYANWITPQPYFRPAVPVQPLPQQQALPPAPWQQPQPQAQAQQAQPGPGGAPMQVARTTDTPSDPQPFRPVMPVGTVGLPFGARDRHYWRHGVLPRQ